MKTFDVKNFSFKYPGMAEEALSDISLEINYGEFVLICGRSGSGKTTLLRHLKPALSPYGESNGEILFYGKNIKEISFEEQSRRIGYVMQNPDNQIVTDKVWHEMAFGLENLGIDPKTIRLRVAEMASFFGIQEWFMKDVDTLSGGQKQLLNLASVMVLNPDVLIMDEPTSQLDPIAANDFLDTLIKINRDIGTTIIMTEQRLDDVFPLADRVAVMDSGKLLTVGRHGDIINTLMELQHPMMASMPQVVQIYEGLDKISSLRSDNKNEDPPITVRSGRKYLTDIFENKKIETTGIHSDVKGKDVRPEGKKIVRLKEVHFKYGKNEEDVLKSLSFDLEKNSFTCLVGGNGTGKSTTLNVIMGIRKPYRGKVETEKGRTVSMLPQNVQTLFVENSVEKDLKEIFKGSDLKPDVIDSKIRNILKEMMLENLAERHPYDLSAGEQQRLALGKVLLTSPDVILLDEPTKGIDNYYKDILAAMLKKLIDRGMTILMVSHDLDFCAKHADKCMLLFEGDVVSSGDPNHFFSGNNFYTTAANRMSRNIFDDAVTVDDVIALCRANGRE